MSKGPKKEKTVKAVRITDPYVLQLIASEQKQSGEATATGTASRLITEFVALKKARVPSPEPVTA